MTLSIREAVLGYARSRETEPRDIRGVQVLAVYARDGSRTWSVNGEVLPAGVVLAAIISAVVAHAAHGKRHEAVLLSDER